MYPTLSISIDIDFNTNTHEWHAVMSVHDPYAEYGFKELVGPDAVPLLYMAIPFWLAVCARERITPAQAAKARGPLDDLLDEHSRTQD